MFHHHHTRLSRFLGWFSIGLGAVELFGGRSLARTLGVPRDERLLRAFGAREAGVGLAILNDPEEPRWLWARVAGDALDLGVLALAVRRPNPRAFNADLAIAAVLGVTALDVICAVRLGRN